MNYVAFPHPEFKTSLSKRIEYSLTREMHMVCWCHPCNPWQLLLLRKPVFSPGLSGWSCITHPRPSWEITLGRMQNQSAMALKGQYVANKHTHRQSKCWAGSQSPAVLYLHYTLCQGITMWRQHGDDRCLTDNKSLRLWEARALSAPAVHRSIRLLIRHAFLLHSWQP